jgi:ABC-type taurine transport system ATPase subunit
MGRTRRLIAAALVAAVTVVGAGWKWRLHATGGGQQRVGWAWSR